MTEAPDFTNSPRLRVVFLGTPEPAAVVLRAAVEAGFRVPLAVTMPDRPRRRGGHKEPSALKQAAIDLGIPVFQPPDINADESVATIGEARPDVLFIVAFGKILKGPLLRVSRLFPVNLHFSLLPEYRGAAPVAWAIAEGREETGVTIQRVVPRLDAGPILAVEKVAIGADETTGELVERLSPIGARLSVRALAAIERGEHEETPQDASRVTKAPKLGKTDGRMAWTRTALELHCHVRAMTPWPGATTVYDGAARKKEVPLSLLRVSTGPGEDSGRPPGEVVAVEPDGILVQTGEGLLHIEALRPAGKKSLTAREFANGYRCAPGDRFA